MAVVAQWSLPEVTGSSPGCIWRKTFAKSFTRACSLWRLLKNGAAKRKFYFQLFKALVHQNVQRAQSISAVTPGCLFFFYFYTSQNIYLFTLFSIKYIKNFTLFISEKTCFNILLLILLQLKLIQLLLVILQMLILLKLFILKTSTSVSSTVHANVISTNTNCAKSEHLAKFSKLFLLLFKLCYFKCLASFLLVLHLI